MGIENENFEKYDHSNAEDSEKEFEEGKTLEQIMNEATSDAYYNTSELNDAFNKKVDALYTEILKMEQYLKAKKALSELGSKAIIGDKEMGTIAEYNKIIESFESTATYPTGDLLFVESELAKRRVKLQEMIDQHEKVETVAKENPLLN